MIKALIFDNNGVLTSTERNGSRALADIFEVEEGEFLSAWKHYSRKVDDGSITSDQFLLDVNKHFGNKSDLAQIKTLYHTFYDRNDEMHEIVNELSKKYEVALLSNFSDDYIEFDKKWRNHETFGEKVFVSAYLGMQKPDDAIYLHVLSNLGINPDEAIFIDDRQENVLAAERLGMRGIIFKTPAQFKNELELLLGKDNV